MKWLSKLIPSRRNSAVVAPAPEDDSEAELTEAERAVGCTLAWPNPGDSQAGNRTIDMADLRQTAAADNRSPVISAEPAADNGLFAMPAEAIPKLEEPSPSPVALAQSLKLAAALASVSAGSTDSTSEGAPGIEVYSGDGNAPLPLELLDSSTGCAMEGLDIDSLLPPLPKADENKQNVKEDIPGSANEVPALPAGMPDLPRSEASCHGIDSTLPSKPQLRPVSFRRFSKQSDIEARFSTGSFIQHKDSASPQKGARESTSGVSSLFSRPTTAGDSAILSFPTSRQSTISLAWDEQWTPGGAVPRKMLGQQWRQQQPLPPPMPAPGETPRSVTSSSSKTPALPLEDDSAMSSEPREIALRRASRRTSLQWATAPSANRSRWSKPTKKGVDELTDPGVPAAAAGYPSEFSRPVSREQVIEGADFSELAVSFAFLDGDM